MYEISDPCRNVIKTQGRRTTLILLANFFHTLHLRPRDDSVTREADEVVGVPAFAFGVARDHCHFARPAQDRATLDLDLTCDVPVAQLGKGLCGPEVRLRVSVCCLLSNSSSIDRTHTMGLNPEVPAFNPPCTARYVPLPLHCYASILIP